jgi:hypothetical protein
LRRLDERFRSALATLKQSRLGGNRPALPLPTAVYYLIDRPGRARLLL